MMSMQEIRRILVTAWDPLAVGDSPRLADEYDSYIPAVARLLARGACEAYVAQFLMGAEASLGVRPDVRRTSRAATRLVATQALLNRSRS